MKRTIATLCIALASGPAAAESLELTYRAVMHVVSAQTLQVLDDPRHQVGIPSFSGLALLADGKVVPHRYAGWFDVTDGKGDFRGTALWRFADGDLTAHYEGRIETMADDFDFSARVHNFTGTGRYAGVSGEGSFKGERYETVATGGATYLEGTLNLQLAD